MLEDATMNLHLASSTAANIHRYLDRRRYGGAGDLSRSEQIFKDCDIDVDLIENSLRKLSAA